MAARKKTAKKTTGKSIAKRTTAKRKPAKQAAARKTTARKPAKKKTAAKRATTRSMVAKKTAISVGKKPFTKSQIISALADQTGMSKKEVSTIFEAMPNVISAHLKKAGPEMFSWPGMFKIVVVKKPAVPARWGVNPFTGEKMKFKAKPARRVVKVRPLKGLKEMAAGA